MKEYKEGILLRISIDESSRSEGRPLYESIVLKAKGLGLAGATVFKGIMGYGSGSGIQSTKVLRLSEDLPVVIEIVDIRENINRLLPYLDENVKEGLITIETVKVIRYSKHKDQT